MKNLMNPKTVGIASVVGVGAMGAYYGLGKLGFFSSAQQQARKILKEMAEAEENQVRSVRYPNLSPASALALEQDDTLSDLVDRLGEYFNYNEDIGQEFTEVAADAAEFLIRQHEVNKKSLPMIFGGFTRHMVMLCRKLRESVRDQAPGKLEEYDELVDEVLQYKKDNHHNMWCDAHSY